LLERLCHVFVLSPLLQAAAAAAAAKDPGPSAAPKEPQKPIVYPNKEAAKEAFKQLLQDFDVPPEASWDNTMRLIIHDARYGALKAMGEKKAAFNEYCTVSYSA
jgi:pre-mRNA-processing factor 40